MANPHRSLLSTLTSVEETHARYRCTTAIRFSSYSHCLQTTKLKVRPNKKILEKEIIAPKAKGKLIASTGTNRIKLFVDLNQSFISPSKIPFVQQNGFQKIDLKKVLRLGRGVSKNQRKGLIIWLVPLLPIGPSAVCASQLWNSFWGKHQNQNQSQLSLLSIGCELVQCRLQCSAVEDIFYFTSQQKVCTTWYA